MGEPAKLLDAAAGFRVKSGWAMAALLAGSPESPQLVRICEVLLSDPSVPQSKQPFHPALMLPEEEGRRLGAQLKKVVKRAAARYVSEFLRDVASSGYRVRAAGMVVGSIVDPATLHNDHIRTHGLEGQLFRTVLEDALRSHSVSCQVLVEKSAYAEAAPAIGKPPAAAKRAVAKLGDDHDGSWRAEEKLAALAAWCAMSGRNTQAKARS
jgi:hypothetical protein